MKELFTVVLAALLLAAAPTPEASPSQEPIRVAIWEFGNNSERRYWFHGDLGDAARNQIDNAFSEDRELARRFTVVERERLDLVMKEQGLGASGAVDAQTAAKLAQILGVRYIVTGGIDKFAINTTSGGFRGIGGSSTTAEATISLRFIDATTAERVLSISADGNVRKGGGFFRGASLSREDEWGIASEAVEAAAKAVVEQLATGGGIDKMTAAAGASGGVDMRVIRLDGQRAYINVGRSSGIRVGDRFTIHRMGEPLIDPVTKTNLGAIEEQVGTGVVTDVQDRFAIITVTGTAAANDVIRKAS
jgi:curli biogenesis system outer membrane secretion channel CsgG